MIYVIRNYEVCSRDIIYRQRDVWQNNSWYRVVSNYRGDRTGWIRVGKWTHSHGLVKRWINLMLWKPTNLTLWIMYFTHKICLKLISCQCQDRSGITTLIWDSFCKFCRSIKGNRCMRWASVKKRDAEFLAKINISKMNGSVVNQDMMKWRCIQNDSKQFSKEVWHKTIKTSQSEDCIPNGKWWQLHYEKWYRSGKPKM